MSDEEQIILPSGFRRLSYIQSSGTQYITTDYYPEAGQKYILMDIKFINISDLWTGNKNIFSASEKGNPSGAYDVLYGCGLNFGGSDNQRYEHFFWLGGDRNDNNSVCSAKWNEDTVLNRNTFEIKGNTCTYGSQTVNIINGGTRAGTTPLTIFGAADKPIGCYGMRLYEFKMGTFENNQVSISLHLIPCLDDTNKVCMYDVVNGKVYYNQGTGKFLIPKDLEYNYPSSDYSLPAGFKKCVYLQSDGTQWIDTGVIPDNETGLYFKALQLSYGVIVPFGVTEGSNGIHPPRFSNKDLYYRWGETAVKMMTWDKADDLIFHSSLNLYNSKIAKFDSEDTDVESYITSQAGTYTIPIRLFSYNFNGSYSATYGKWGGRIYRAQITQGTDLIHDYVPCLDANGRPCMYDIIGGGTVEDNTYYNQSGGTEFAYCVEHQLPSDFIKLKYLESTGTQYINIGIIPTNETGLYVDAQQITHTNSHVISSGVDTNSTGFGVPRFLKGTANSCGFMWKGWNSYGNIGNGTRFESCLNLYNDRKATLKTAGTTERNNTLGELGFTPTVPLHAFRGNYASAGNWNGRIYRAKITQGSELVRDFVPALDQRNIRPCMYDLINNVAYYNDGSGEFLTNRDFEGNYKGSGLLGGIGNKLGCVNFDPELPRGYKRVAYLESTGTQFINTELDIVGLSVEVTFRGYNYAGGDGLTVCGADAGASNRFIITVNPNNGVGYHYLVSNAGEYSWYGIGGLKFGDLGTVIIDSHNKIMSAKSGNNFSQKIIEDKYLPTQSAYCHLFTRGSYLTGHNSYYNAQAKIYSFKANYAGVPAANYIPCLDPNNKPCMFDLITQQPFYNKGNGEDFKYGLF